jgi:hypothetical protein
MEWATGIISMIERTELEPRVLRDALDRHLGRARLAQAADFQQIGGKLVQ